MKLLMMALFAAVLFSCNNSDTERAKADSSTVKNNTVDTLKKIVMDTPAVVFGYIKGIDKIHDSIFLKIDSVFFYHGPNLDSMAKLYKVDDYSDDYFIVNKDKKLWRIYLPDGIPITMDAQIAGEDAKDINTYGYFSKHYIDNLFRIRIKDNRLVTIAQQYLP